MAGDGVNIAARLESIAPLDGLCISSSAREQIRDDLGIAFKDLGDQQLKNIARPIRAFAVSVAGGPQGAPKVGLSAATGHIDVSLPDKPSIAVLPCRSAATHSQFYDQFVCSALGIASL